ncbi:MAG: cobalamin biosynthesis protein CobW [Candidatus Dojkabacteria bacterium]|nr:MAG: cobalamin biosynthesis protein CobW [Candidatus Dojkabacteria bacterium]
MIPVNVFSGELGAGKTTIILKLIEQIPYTKTVWLKNEFGDVNIDSEIAKSKHILTKEVINGCLCCVLIGKLGDALLEIKKEFNPERIVIETAGTAHPYPIIKKISELDFCFLDSNIKVVDAKNFKRVKDVFLAKKQANFFDLIVVNKANLVEKSQLEKVIEDLNEVYYKVPKIISNDGFVPKDLVIDINISSSKKLNLESMDVSDFHNDIETFSFVFEHETFNQKALENFLIQLNKTKFFRIKGILNFGHSFKIVNFAYGDFKIQNIKNYEGKSKIIFMGDKILDQKNKIYNFLKECTNEKKKFA